MTGFAAKHAWTWQSRALNCCKTREICSLNICARRLRNFFRLAKKQLLEFGLVSNLLDFDITNEHVLRNEDVFKETTLWSLLFLGGACNTGTKYTGCLWDTGAVLWVCSCACSDSWKSKVSSFTAGICFLIGDDLGMFIDDNRSSI